MHTSVLEFFIEHMEVAEFEGRRVLEVGSAYGNGSVRPLIVKFGKPAEYIGTDIKGGKFVDRVVSAERLVEEFGEESFDVVVCTEVLEHVVDWRLAINNMKAVLRPGGILYLTTRTVPYPYHGSPHDHWRFYPEDMERIFSDFYPRAIVPDPQYPGVFVKAYKPHQWQAADLSPIAVYSVLIGRKTTEVPTWRHVPLLRRLVIRIASSESLWRTFPFSVMLGLRYAIASRLAGYKKKL